jgi:hypothetical protein
MSVQSRSSLNDGTQRSDRLGSLRQDDQLTHNRHEHDQTHGNDAKPCAEMSTVVDVHVEEIGKRRKFSTVPNGTSAMLAISRGCANGARQTRTIGGFRNTLTAGVNMDKATIDSNSYWYANTYPYGSYPAHAIPGTTEGAGKGLLASSTLDKPKNASVHVSDAFMCARTSPSISARNSSTRCTHARTV